MEKLNVLIVSRLRPHQSYLEDITAVDPRISVRDGTKHFVAELRRKGTKGPLVDFIEQQVDLGADWQTTETQEDFDAMLARAEVLFGSVIFPEKLISRAPRLKWLHISGTGIDRYMETGLFGGDVMITNGRGALAVSIAEHVLAFMLMLTRDAPRLLANKQDKRWDRFDGIELNGKTVGIIGMGALGSRIIHLTKCIGMKVLATRRSATRRESGVFGVDELYPPSALHQMLSESDFVVIAVPLTEETKVLIGEAELRAMKPTAYLINVGRGPIVNEPVLTRALKEGWIAGAGLDVFESEPLSTESELWEMPNVLLSPHIAGWSDRRSQRSFGIFLENLRRYLAGEQLINLINLQKKEY